MGALLTAQAALTPRPCYRRSMMKPELTNRRAEREWQYLVDRVGLDVATKAIMDLPGNRKAFPFNIAKILGVQLPPEECLPLPSSEVGESKERARQELAKIRASLKL